MFCPLLSSFALVLPGLGVGTAASLFNTVIWVDIQNLFPDGCPVHDRVGEGFLYQIPIAG